MLYRWFVGLGMDAPIGSPTTVSKKRERLLASDVASAFFDAVVTQARAAGLLSDEHVTVATSAQRRRGRRRTIRAIRRSISTARAARRPRLGPRPIRTRRSFAKGAPAPSAALWATSCSTIAMASWSLRASRPRPAPPSGTRSKCCVRRGTVAGAKNDDRRRGVRWLRGQGLTPPVRRSGHAAPSTAARPGIPATPSGNRRAHASSTSSAG